MRLYSKAVGAALLIKTYVSSPCQGKSQESEQLVSPSTQGKCSFAMTRFIVAIGAEGIARQ
jgi:hypothetical protein